MRSLIVGAMALLFASTAAAAEPAPGTLPQAAQSLATQVRDALAKAKRSKQRVAVAFEATPPAVQLGEAVSAELVRLGLTVVDRKSLESSLKDAGLLAGADAAKGEAVAAVGAQLLLTGSVRLEAGQASANVRLLDATAGTVVAALTAAYAAEAPISAAPEGVAAAPPPSPGVLEARTLETELRRLADRIATGLGKLDGEVRYQRFAVLPFEEVGAGAKEHQLGTLVAAELGTKLQRDHDLMLVERAQVARLLDEIALAQTGVLDEATSVEMGKLAGAQALVVGTVSTAGAAYVVNAKVVGAADGTVMFSEQAELPAADLVALSADAVVLRSTSGAVFRSILVPGWGQFYNNEPIKGGVFIGAEVAAVGLSLTFVGLAADARGRYKALGIGTSADTFASVRAESRTYYEVALGMAIAALAVHAANVLDAFLSGRTYELGGPGAGGGGEAVAPFVW